MTTRQELWQMQYRAKRYLQHLSLEDLAQRFNDILANLTVLTEDGTIGCLRPSEGEGVYWWMVCTHVLDEWFLRGETLPRLGPLARTAQVPRSTWPQPPQALKALQGRKATNILAKYGKRQHLRESLHKGLVRIVPASSYSDPSLNRAIKDNELEISVLIPSSDIRVKIPAYSGGPPVVPVQVLDNVTYTWRSKTDYFVYCLSMALDCRLFDDFQADACLIITQPKEFIERLESAFERAMSGWSGISRPVQYVDPFLQAGPLRTSGGKLDVHLCKHFRYSYQREYRCIWLPDHAQQSLTPVFLELGSLEDCCEIIEL